MSIQNLSSFLNQLIWIPMCRLCSRTDYQVVISLKNSSSLKRMAALERFWKNYFINVKNRICPLGMNFAFPKTWPWPLVNLDWGHVFRFLIFLVSMQIRFFTWASFGLMANLEKTQNWIFCNFSTNLCYVPSWNMHSYQVSLLPTHGSDTFASQFP